MPTALTRRYMTQAKALRDRGRSGAAAAFRALPAVNDGTFDQWLDSVRPITNATSTASASLAQAFTYAAAAVVVRNVLDPRAYTQEQIGVSPFADRYRDPFVGYYNALSNGQHPDEARAVAASRAGLAVDHDAQWAATTMISDAAGQVQKQTGRRPRFNRIPEEGACAFCLLVATRTYYRDDLAPVHGGCGCGIEPVFA